MFAKVYTQIFASSIAENYTTRHVFMDLLVLADSEGVVDMTVSAIARTTNVPIEVVMAAIKELSEPDLSSRSPAEEGRRIALVDSHRDWGWRIINYDHYRSLRDEEARRSFNRNYMRDYREKNKPVRDVRKCKSLSKKVGAVDSGKALSTHAEAEEDAEGEGNTNTGASEKLRKVQEGESRLKEMGLLELWGEFKTIRKKKGGASTPTAEALILERLFRHPGHIKKGLEKAITSSWIGFQWDWVDKSLSNAPARPTRPRQEAPSVEVGPMPGFQEKLDRSKAPVGETELEEVE